MESERQHELELALAMTATRWPDRGTSFDIEACVVALGLTWSAVANTDAAPDQTPWAWLTTVRADAVVAAVEERVQAREDAAANQPPPCARCGLAHSPRHPAWTGPRTRQAITNGWCAACSDAEDLAQIEARAAATAARRSGKVSHGFGGDQAIDQAIARQKL